MSHLIMSFFEQRLMQVSSKILLSFPSGTVWFKQSKLMMLEVTCAIIQKEQKILICQRAEKMKLPLKWEFPGGKVESDETKEECIVREIKEELNLDVEVLGSLNEVTHHYPDFSITLIPFVCRLTGGDLKPKEHRQAIWVNKDELSGFDWAAADIPIVEWLTAKQ